MGIGTGTIELAGAHAPSKFWQWGTKQIYSCTL